jgi:hypothetical protein
LVGSSAATRYAALDAAPATGSEEAAQGEEQKNDDDQENEHVTRFL